MKIIWCIVEMWSATDRIFSHFAFGPFFLSFHPPNNPENQNLEKMKKTLEISSFQVYHYHEWQSYDVDSWLRYEVQQTYYFVILCIFFCHLCPFMSLTTQQIKILKNTWRYSSFTFYTSVQKIMIICYLFLRFGT